MINFIISPLHFQSKKFHYFITVPKNLSHHYFDIKILITFFALEGTVVNYEWGNIFRFISSNLRLNLKNIQDFTKQYICSRILSICVRKRQSKVRDLQRKKKFKRSKTATTEFQSSISLGRSSTNWYGTKWKIYTLPNKKNQIGSNIG